MYFHPSLAHEMYKVQQQEWQAEVRMHQMYWLVRGGSNGHRMIAGLGRLFDIIRTGIVRAIHSNPGQQMHYGSRA
jgi:hypothetical protein